MADKMAMDVEEYSDRSLAIGKGLDSLCDKFYAATQDELSSEEIQELLVQGKNKVALFNKLCEETSGGMQEGLKKKYLRYIEEINTYSRQLEEKIND